MSMKKRLPAVLAVLCMLAGVLYVGRSGMTIKNDLFLVFRRELDGLYQQCGGFLW